MTEDGGANTNGCDVAPARALDLQEDAANFALSLAVGDAALALTGGAQVSRQSLSELRAEAKKAEPAT
jgi:hypothetical protein